MKFKIIEPSESLKDFVNYFWVLEQSEKNEEIIPERIVPPGYLQMFFHYKTPFSDEAGQNPQSYFCGQLTKWKDIQAHKNTGMIAVVFYPFAAKAFTHYPINELTDKSIALQNIYGNEVTAIEELIKSNISFEAKTKLIETFLKRHFMIANKYQYGLIKQAIQIIDDSFGAISINGTADKLHISKRQFERLFKSIVGITPKAYVQIVRFYNALQKMNSEESLIDVCYQFNYYDQAHFIKEFKRFTGMNPKQYFSHKTNKLEQF